VNALGRADINGVTHDTDAVRHDTDEAHRVTRVTLVRHGRTAWNAQARIQGQIDIPLDDTGRWQAQRMGQALAGEDIAIVYTSDLTRAAHTAKALADVLGVPIETDARLRERHFGAFEGMTFADLDVHHVDAARRWRTREPSFAPEGGESLIDFNQRSVDAVTRLARRHAGHHIAVVSHGGVLDAMYRAGSRVPLEQARSWHIGNASIHRMMLSAEGWTIVGWNDEFHLDQNDDVSRDDVSRDDVSSDDVTVR
jgi:2,3-bisphosphoglycerate-dependent phosphoglycerate mutase